MPKKPAVGDVQCKAFYQLPDGRQIPIDPKKPEAAQEQLPGPVVGTLPPEWDPACNDEGNRDLYEGDVPDLDYFKSVQFFPLGASYMMTPGAGLPFLDPYGILNPAALPPISPLPALGERPISGQAPKSRFWCC